MMKLLDRLREVDPKVHADICEILELLEYEGVPVFLDGLIANWIVQGMIQQAIERRCENEWCVSKDGMRNGRRLYVADIWASSDSDNDRSEYGDSPAEALLSVYINLMETME